jgi:hypothetical protein
MTRVRNSFPTDDDHSDDLLFDIEGISNHSANQNPFVLPIEANDTTLLQTLLDSQNKVHWDLILPKERAAGTKENPYYPTTLYNFTLDKQSYDAFKILHQYHLKTVFLDVGKKLPAIFTGQDLETIYKLLEMDQVRLTRLPLLYVQKVLPYAQENGYFARELLTLFLFSSASEIENYLSNASEETASALLDELFPGAVLFTQLNAYFTAESQSTLPLTLSTSINSLFATSPECDDKMDSPYKPHSLRRRSSSEDSD